jgi:lysophospholipase L1-like esterase
MALIRRTAFLVGFALLSFASGAVAQSALPARPADSQCAAPAELRGFHADLPHTAEAVGKGRKLVVVALGSSSTVGTGASRPDLAYPVQLADTLRRLWPTVAISVYNEGVGGETTDKMLARLDRSVLVHHPQLVIWQTGSNGLLQNREKADRGSLLRQGIARIAAAGADTVLMDPQYAPMLLDNAHYNNAVADIAAVAAETKVGLLRRSDIMRYWVESGYHRMDELVVSDRLHMTDLGYTCVAHLLASGMAAAVQHPGQPAVALRTGK